MPRRLASVVFLVAYNRSNVINASFARRSLDDVDAQLGDQVPKIRFVEAVCKSLGYNNSGRDHGVTVQLLPPNVDPRFSVKAAEGESM